MLQILKGVRYSRLMLVAVMGAAMAVAGCGKKAGTTDSSAVVATYKGGKITKDEMTKFGSIYFSQYGSLEGNNDLEEYVLKQLATLKILSAKASDQAKKDGAADAEKQVKQMEDSMNAQNKDAFNNQLKQLNLTRKELVDYVTMSGTVVKDAAAKVTDQQMKDEYDKKLKDDPHAFDVASVAHILIALKDPSDTTGQKDLRTKDEAKKRADEVKAKLDAGGDFAALAKQYSDDPGSKDKGGIYENEKLATTMWDPAFKKAAMEQPVGVIGAPFESSFGYHIMRVDKRQAQTFDEVKDSLKNDLADGTINDFMKNELPKLDYKTNLPAPSPSASAGAAASPAAGAASPAASAAASPAASAAASPAASPAAK